jgi:hypothetical protein
MSGYGLVMPFVVVTSVGGPYEDAAFVAGYGTGQLDARMQYEKPITIECTVLSELTRQIDLSAMRHGYRLRATPSEEYPEWTFIRLTRISRA